MKLLELSPTKTELEYLSSPVPEYNGPVDDRLREWYEAADPDGHPALLYLVKFNGAPGALGVFEVSDEGCEDSGRERSEVFRIVVDNARRICEEPPYKDFQFLFGEGTGFAGFDEIVIFFPYQTPPETVHTVLARARTVVLNLSYRPEYLPLPCPGCPDRDASTVNRCCPKTEQRCRFAKSYTDHRGVIFQVSDTGKGGWYTSFWNSSGGERAYLARAALQYIPTRPTFTDAQSELNRFAQVMGLREHY